VSLHSNFAQVFHEETIEDAATMNPRLLAKTLCFFGLLSLFAGGVRAQQLVPGALKVALRVEGLCTVTVDPAEPLNAALLRRLDVPPYAIVDCSATVPGGDQVSYKDQDKGFLHTPHASGLKAVHAIRGGLRQTRGATNPDVYALADLADAHRSVTLALVH